LTLLEKNYKRIVIKVGASLLYSDRQGPEYEVFKSIAGQLGVLVKDKKEVILVSSGAIALGMHILGLKARPKKLNYLQAAAAIGQSQLMETYRKYLAKDIKTAQVLLTWEDFSDRKRYLNAKNTLLTLLKIGSVPIINENDTISTDEIKFGDNDRLSALVASLVGADLLIILSDVDGLLMKDKKTVVKLVDEITPEIKQLACPTDKKTCVGGMITKLEAAKISTNSGTPCVIVNGRGKDIILDTVSGCQTCGTLFIPKKGYLQAKKQWLAFSAKTKGSIMVDEGAKQALFNHKSLLSVGVTAIEGNFDCGDIVSVVDREDREIAKGKARISSKQLEKVKGSRFHQEVIHRDNIVIL
jgi:glutamate 5-kinase